MLRSEPFADSNELEIVRVGGLPPIVSGIQLCADMLGGETSKVPNCVSFDSGDNYLCRSAACRNETSQI
jgi:hypothetical protein